MSGVTSCPGVDDVVRIAAMRNRVLRNLEITQCYAELSDGMRGRIGDAANWCTFATWASRQAGVTIRGEDLKAHLGRRLRQGSRLLEPFKSLNRMLLRKGLFEPETRLGRVIAAIHTPFDAFERASEAVAIGNLKVFEEIAQVFARFLAMVPADVRSDSEAFTAFAATLRPGPPPDGQQYLQEAFAHYQDQRQEPDATLRAGWILLANLKIGLHEQTRLQSQITAAVDAPLTTAHDLGARVLHRLLPHSHRWWRVVFDPVASTIGVVALAVHRGARRLTREVVTDSMMVLALPNGVLALGSDLDAPVPAIFAERVHDALQAFVREYDPCPPGVTACGANNWCDLRERMHYILHLFRAYAQEPALFSRPFPPESVTRFRAGTIPDGTL